MSASRISPRTLLVNILFLVLIIFSASSPLAQWDAAGSPISTKLETAEQRAAMANVTFTVNNTTDAVDADTADGICDTDLVAGGEQCSLRAAIQQANATAGLDAIHFNIPGAGPHTIQPNSALPEITDPVILDGYTQPGAAPATSESPATMMIELDGSNAGIHVSGLTITAGNTTITGLVVNSFPGDGLSFSDRDGNLISGNYIGTNVSGTTGLGNRLTGIDIIDSSNNLIGGITPDSRNIISSNSNGVAGGGAGGIQIRGAVTGNTIQGNYIGTDVSGVLNLGDNRYGVAVEGSNNIIGGSIPGAGNLIAFNNGGLLLLGNGANNVIQGNYIGTDPTGALNLGNQNSGITVDSNTVLANHLIGGTESGEQNIIAFNMTGIEVKSLTGIQILSNSIFANSGLGIDLQPYGGPTENDPNDVDTGANNLQNYPFISAVTSSGGDIIINGNLHSVSNTSFRVEFFSNTTCDPSGFGEGETFVGFIELATNGTGNAPFSVSVPTPAGQFITSTATDPAGNTSEFSLCTQIEQTHSTVVTNANDSGPGSLRTAMNISNANAGEVDTITFNIPGAGPYTIQLTSSLPGIKDPVIIDGYSQPGAVPATSTSPAILMIEIDGNNDFGGIEIRDTSNNTIKGLHLDRLAYGISIVNSSGNTIAGNFVTNRIELTNSDNNLIGGTTPADRNIFHQIAMRGNGNVLQGNYANVRPNMTRLAPNNSPGIGIEGSNNVIGGSVLGAGNLIGFNGEGIRLEGDGNTIQGNYLGTDPSGTLNLWNHSGILVSGDNNIIGGTLPGAGNLIAFTYVSVSVDGTNNLIQGNYVGTDPTGTLNLGERGDGVRGDAIQIFGSNNIIGGSDPGAGNLVAFNYRGVTVWGTGHQILSNSIFSNDELGIDLGNDGLTLNDAGDTDTGANNFQNYPVIISATIYGDELTTLSGTLDSIASTVYRVEIFANDECDLSGHGEGHMYLGYTEVLTDETGSVSFEAAFDIIGGTLITATATDPLGNTSEFSACLEATVVQVRDDVFETDFNTPLNVSAPGFLANDDNLEQVNSVSLISGPISGNLIFNPDGSFDYSSDTDIFGNFSFVYAVEYGSVLVHGSWIMEATVTINVKGPPRPEGVVTATNNANISIPDLGDFCGHGLSLVDITNAPFGARVTKVEFSTRVVHQRTGNITLIRLANAQGIFVDVWNGSPYWNNDQGHDDDPELDVDIDLRNRVFETQFDGNFANQQWGALAFDCVYGQTGGYIDSFTVKVHYVPIADPPILMEPQGTIINHYGNPEFVWTDILGGVYYEIMVIRKSDNKVVVNETDLYYEDYCEYPVCTLDLTVLGEENRLNAGEYDVWLRALYSNHQHIVDWSGPFTFTLEADPPAPPTIGEVTDNVTTTPTFNWALADGPADYATWFNVMISNRDLHGNITTQVSSTWHKRGVICGDGMGTECSLVSPVTLPTGKPYAVQIRSYGPGGTSVGGPLDDGWSDIVLFSVGGDPAALPGNILSNPRQGRPQISWDDDPNTTWVQLWMGGQDSKGIYQTHSQWYSRTTGALRFSCDAGRCYIEPNVNWLNGTYVVWMQAWGPGGYSMGGADAPTAPSWIQGADLILSLDPPLPPDGLAVTWQDTTNPTFHWNGMTNATWYQIFVDPAAEGNQWNYGTWHLGYTLGQDCGDASGVCSWTDPVLNGALPPGEYVFRVLAWGPGGMSESSPDQPFSYNQP